MNGEQYYILNKNILLRKWTGTPPGFLWRGKRGIVKLEEEEYDFLTKCDGNTLLKRDLLADKLEISGLIHPVEKGTEELLPGQMKEYSNHMLRGIELNITDHCNYNCLHCFHAADNTAPRSVFTYEEVIRFLDEMRQCGIRNLRLTGGEPTLHPQFRQILQDIRDRNIYLEILLTNGSTMDEDLAAYIKSLHPNTEIRISFDGIGFHDWMRNHPGCEEKTLEAIRICKRAGLLTFININVNRKNREAIFDSVKLMDETGVDTVRIIKTTEAPRWELNAKGQSFSIPEYYDFCLNFASKVKNSTIRTKLILWQCLYMDPEKKHFSCLPVKTGTGRYDENMPICRAALAKTSVMAQGNIYPCSAYAGLCEKEGIEMGNVKKQGLKAVLSESTFLTAVTHTAGEKHLANEKCGNCRYFEYCQGGCPVLSLAFKGALLAPDVFKCTYFENGWYERFCNVLDGWENRNPMIL